MKCSRANTFVTNLKAVDAACTTVKSSDVDESKLKGSIKHKTTLVQNSNSSKCMFCGESYYTKGHNSKYCRNRAMCDLCKKCCLTPLHEDHPSADRSSSQRVVQAEENASSLSCCVNEGEGSSTSMIIPVWLS